MWVRAEERTASVKLNHSYAQAGGVKKKQNIHTRKKKEMFFFGFFFPPLSNNKYIYNQAGSFFPTCCLLPIVCVLSRSTALSSSQHLCSSIPSCCFFSPLFLEPFQPQVRRYLDGGKKKSHFSFEMSQTGSNYYQGSSCCCCCFFFWLLLFPFYRIASHRETQPPSSLSQKKGARPRFVM